MAQRRPENAMELEVLLDQHRSPQLRHLAMGHHLQLRPADNFDTVRGKPMVNHPAQRQLRPPTDAYCRQYLLRRGH